MPSRTTTTNHRRPRLAAVLTAVLAGLLLGLVAVVPATATPPFALPDQITDQVGAVEGHTAEIQAAIDDLQAEHGIRLWVVFVDTFDGTDPQAWADQTFTATGLGVDDYLLAVAMADRQYGYVVDQAFVLGDAALARVASAAERHLAENPPRAVTTAASTIGDELGEAAAAPRAQARSESGETPADAQARAKARSEFGSAFLILAGFALGIAGLVTIFVRTAKWRVDHGMTPFEGLDGWDTGSSHDNWSSGSGGSSSGGGGGGGGGTRGGSGRF